MASTPPMAIPRGSFSAHAATNDREQTLPQQPPLRLQTRRGSRSAPDPWALGPLTSSSMAVGGPDNISAASGVGATGTSGYHTPASSVGATATIPSTSASRITIVRVHDDSKNDSAVDAADPSDGTPSSFGATNASPRPGRSNSWGSNYSPSSNQSPGRSHSPGGGRRFGGASFSFVTFRSFPAPFRHILFVSISLNCLLLSLFAMIAPSK
jgi:hypothetical protein